MADRTNDRYQGWALHKLQAGILNVLEDWIDSIAGGLPVIPNGSIIDEGNSSTTVLGAGGVFPGAWIDVLEYAAIIVSVRASHASATDGLHIQWSDDGVTQRDSDQFDIAADTGKTFSFQPAWRYFKVEYTNGGTLLTSFQLQTQLKKSSVKSSSHRIADSISGQDDAELIKSVLTGADPDGIFRNILATIDGVLKVSDESSGLAIAEDLVTGKSFIHKFGAAPDFDVGDGFVTVWDAAEDGVAWELMNYIYSTTAAIDSISSTDNGDTVDIEIQGLDANYDLVTQTITLQGNTRVALDTDLIRVFRAKNVSAVDLDGHVIIYENDTQIVVPGVPDDPNLIRAVIQPENNQTEMAVYTIPNGFTGYMRDWYASTAGAKRDSQHTMLLKARPFGQVFQLKHKANISVTGTSYIQHKYEEPEVFAAKTDIEMQMDTDQDIAGVAGGFDIVLVQD